MDRGLNLHIIFLVGSLMAVLSFILLNPTLIFKSLNTATGKIQSTRSLHKLLTGIIGIGATSAILTASVTKALFILVIPAFFGVVEFLVRSHIRKRRQSEITKGLPILLDFLVFQIESGHSVQQSLRSATRLFKPGSCMNEELLALDNSMRLGLPLNQAIDNFGRRLEHPTADVPLMMISQAIQHGLPLGTVLRNQSRKMREDLILKGEEFANKVSVKILIPLLFLVFPASFLVIFSPVIVSFAGRLP